MLTKPGSELTLFDKLSRLSFLQATKLLGPEGSDLIAAGGKHDIDITTQVEFDQGPAASSSPRRSPYSAK
jgi:hypothetical protein